MNLLKSTLIAPSLALLLCTNLFAQENYTIKEKTLTEALEIIAKKAKLPYIAEESLLKGKKAPSLQDVTGVQNALNEVLKNTDLEAVIKNDTIIIRKKVLKKESSSNLGDVEVIENAYNTTEGSNSYTIASMNTATKMNLSIKETPQSVSVITNTQMEDLNIQRISDVVQASTGITTNSNGTGHTNNYSRGFRIFDYQIDGILVDIGSDYGNLNHSMDLYDRAEVVRGANGLTVGVGDPSASINLVRKKPKSHDFKGNVELEIASWNKKRLSLDIQGALTKKGDLRARLVASKSNEDFFVDILEKDKTLLYGVVEKDISDNTLLTAGYSYQEHNSNGYIFTGLPSKFTDGSKTNWDRSKTFASPWAKKENTQKSFFTKLEHNFKNDIKLSLDYSYAKYDLHDVYARVTGEINKSDGSGLNERVSGQIVNGRSKAINLYTSIPFELMELEHEFIAGYSFTKSHDDYFNIEAADASRNINNAYTFKGSKTPTWTEPANWGPMITKNTAFYTASRLSLSDDTKVILGARLSDHTYVDKSYEDDNTNEKNVLTPYFGITHNLNPNYTMYLAYTDIFKPQTNRTKEGKILDPVVGKNYETGVKASFMEDKLNANLSIYRMEQTNTAHKDEGQTVLNTSEDAFIAGKGDIIKGFDAEISGEINDKLNISFGYSQFTTSSIYKNSPEKNLKLSGNYKFDKVSIGSSLRWKDELINTRRNQKASTVVDLFSKYDIKNNLAVQINISNVFDKKYKSSSSDDSYDYGEPRKISARLKYTF